MRKAMMVAIGMMGSKYLSNSPEPSGTTLLTKRRGRYPAAKKTNRPRGEGRPRKASSNRVLCQGFQVRWRSATDAAAKARTITTTLKTFQNDQPNRMITLKGGTGVDPERYGVIVKVLPSQGKDHWGSN